MARADLIDALAADDASTLENSSEMADIVAPFILWRLERLIATSEFLVPTFATAFASVPFGSNKIRLLLLPLKTKQRLYSKHVWDNGNFQLLFLPCGSCCRQFRTLFFGSLRSRAGTAGLDDQIARHRTVWPSRELTGNPLIFLEKLQREIAAG